MALLSLHRNLKMLGEGWAKPELPFDCSLLHFVFEMSRSGMGIMPHLFELLH